MKHEVQARGIRHGWLFGMEEQHRKEIEALTEGKIRWDYPLGRHTTFKAGGHVEAYYEADNIHNLREVIRFLSSEDIPYFVVGKGSNLLITDNGFHGVAIRLVGQFEDMRIQEDGSTVLESGAGASVWRILTFCKKKRLKGLEFLAGIPATAGGVVTMNAGAFGRSISERVNWVELIGPDASVKRLSRQELNFSYRAMRIEQGSAVIKICFLLEPGTTIQVSEAITQYMMKRKQTQPLEYPSAGSVFKNPPGDYAGRLIEECQLKGMRAGDAMISPKHANFIVNTGQATAAQILYLIDTARRKVKEKFGVELELEIRVLGK